MNSERWSKDVLIEAIKISRNKSDVLRNLGLNSFTGNYDTLNRYIKKYKLDVSHLKRRGINKRNYNHNKQSLKNILIEKSTYTNRSKLKERLYKEGLKERKCEKCGQDEWWYGEKMSLILDHINGINNDNLIENLRIVCPNCNATLPTHCGKNVKDKKQKLTPKVKINKKILKYCSCGKEIREISKTCIDCHNKKNRKVERPPYEQLINEINELGYSATGRKYGVSDNAIRKWVKTNTNK